MSKQWLSVEQVAERLDLHVRTVRGYIRDGRLPAVRIGKQYRIAAADLDAFTGRSPNVTAPDRPVVEVSAVVDLDGVDAGDADRLGTLLVAGAESGSGASAEPPLRLQTGYDPARARLKIVVFGGPADVAAILSTIDLMTRPGSGMFHSSTAEGAGEDG
ncbi:helix-turn-helix domain-containing protein [Solwaraspora sp. WMMD791]|uniref:helix-turn-helix domain-containing protein n=1 Tax=Solwaraspora sp. WMMD791 TaxID=3016086 RepID=UPI002499B97C|nr:helix-turn-helix domain-containing protein [Solwaraspora sp. WMMD791]WFE25995.1 helix-turn-helix domain-containing protein [Solwaraspora sp. WMMD791]